MKCCGHAEPSTRVDFDVPIRAAFIELQKEGKGEVTDERCVESLRRLKKQREDSILSYEQASRPDLAATERAELAMVVDVERNRISKVKIEKLPGQVKA